MKAATVEEEAKENVYDKTAGEKRRALGDLTDFAEGSVGAFSALTLHEQ